ncbi:MAG: TolC family protein, partial [Burkholderiales bacterium]|nr:TolC family protein [Burkholderiales bacterium]
MMNRTIIAALSIVALLAGCAIGPNFKSTPPTQAPAWNAPLPHGGDTVALVDWWRAWNDATLVMLIAQAQRENSTIAQAAARISQARATVRAQTAALLPSFTGNASDIRSKGGANGMGGNFTGAVATESERDRTRSIALDAAWELD